MKDENKYNIDSWPFASVQHYIKSLGHSVVEVRLIRKNPYLVNGTGRREWKGRMVSGYFNNMQMLENAIAPYLKDTDTEGIYVTLQQCDPRLLARSANELKSVHTDDTTKDHNIENWSIFPIDVDDPDRPSGISATQQEILLAREKTIEIQEWFEERNIPTIRAFSGNGFHILIYLEPVPVTEENTNLVKELGDRIVERWNTDPKVYNPARIFKLYGTYARKGSDTKDRKHRCSQIKLPDDLQIIKRVTLDELTAAIAELPLPEEPVEQTNSSKRVVTVSSDKRFHGDSRDEWKTYAEQVLGVTNVGPWKSKKNYFVANCTCPFCIRPRHAFITYSNEGAPGIRCHSKTCHGKSLEDLYQQKNIGKSERNVYYSEPKTYQKSTGINKRMENNQISIQSELQRIQPILQYDFGDPDDIENVSRTEKRYYWYDIPCPFHDNCVGYVRICKFTDKVMPADWVCETERTFKRI